jgi:hypothetical protein
MSRINKFVRDIETAANMLVETFTEMERSGVKADRVNVEPASDKVAAPGRTATSAAAPAGATGGSQNPVPPKK